MHTWELILVRVFVMWIQMYSNLVKFEPKSSDIFVLSSTIKKCTLFLRMFYSIDFQRSICSLLLHSAGLFHARVSFELPLAVNTLRACGGGVCTLFVEREKLFSRDASGRFACIRAAEGNWNPFLSSRAPLERAHAQKQTDTYTLTKLMD